MNNALKQNGVHLGIFDLCAYILRQKVYDSHSTITAGSITCSDNFKY